MCNNNRRRAKEDRRSRQAQTQKSRTIFVLARPLSLSLKQFKVLWQRFRTRIGFRKNVDILGGLLAQNFQHGISFRKLSCSAKAAAHFHGNLRKRTPSKASGKYTHIPYHILYGIFRILKKKEKLQNVSSVYTIYMRSSRIYPTYI